MAQTDLAFGRETLTVNGASVVMLTAGSGPPLLHLHGAGTWHGFDYALKWAEHHRVLVPYHPGFGDSGDEPRLETPHDYVMHYLDLIDQLCLDQVDLVGFSMGGRLSATFASEHRRRVRKLVLVAPAGLETATHRLPDFSKIPPEEIPGYLSVDPERTLTPHLPATLGPEWEAARARESAGMGKLLEHGLLDRKFEHWLHRLNMPSLLVWGDMDRITPVEQAAEWLNAVPGLEFRRIAGGGHLVLDDCAEAVAVVDEFLLRV